MNAVLRVEIIGENIRPFFEVYRNAFNSVDSGKGDMIFGKWDMYQWVAEITGFDEKYKYARKFLKYQKDYSGANRKGSAGIYAEYILESGHLYQVNPSSRWKRYFCIVTDDGDINKIKESEAIEWLNNTSA